MSPPPHHSTIRSQQRTSISEVIVDQHHYDRNYPTSQIQQRLAVGRFNGTHTGAMVADGWGSGGTVYSPPSAVQLVIFPNVIGVQQQRRCGGGEIRTSYILISEFLVSPF
jgi:hypothetical protein